MIECFLACETAGVVFGVASKFERICAEAFYPTRIESVSIPDCVVDLGKRCL